MGYSTSIYAVDLDKLKAAVGSGDARLLKRLLPRGKAGRGKRAGEVIRILVNKKSEIYLNGRRVSFDELVAEVSRPKWKWSYALRYDAPVRTGRWRGDYTFMKALQAALPSPDWLNTQYCYTLEDFKRGYIEDEGRYLDDKDDRGDISEEEAAADLVEGGALRARYGSEYGYGLEKLCELFGTLLAGIEGKGGMLQALKLNTPLSKERSQVKLPKSKDDFPAIGYLTADEVGREAKRLAGMDLSYPRDEEIEEDRKELLRALQKAAKKQLGVVAFYH